MSKLRLTPDLEASLEQVHREVNALPYKSDPELYDKGDFWQRIGEAGPGDCEDYALEKRWRLHKQHGIGFKYLLLALCWIETGEYHAVLIVPVEGGDLVLDNRWDRIANVAELRERGYVFDKALKQDGPGWQKAT